MKKTFLMCALGGRLPGLIQMVSSLSEYGKDWHINILLQKYPLNERIIVEEHLKRIFGDKWRVSSMDAMTGCHFARCAILDSDTSDVWCVIDDDMLAIKGITNYDKMADILQNDNHIGLLSSNWRKTKWQVLEIPLVDKLSKQNIVYTGGGLMFRQDLAEIIKKIPRTQYLFDNPLWSIYSYVNGYDNYRYLGSAAVHQVCSKGGRRKWIAETDSTKRLPPDEWIKTRRGKGAVGGNDEWLMCDSSDITKLAHDLHSKNRREHDSNKI